MQMYSRVAAAFALLAASLPALAASATATRAWQFKPESNAGLTVRNLMGTVRVERGTASGFHVTATTTIDAPSQAEADRLIGLVEFRTADVGAGSRLDVRLPRTHFPKIYSERGADGWWSVSYVQHLGERIRLVGKPGEAPAVRVDLLIRAPAGAKLEVENTFGDAVAQGYSGTLRLDGGSDLLSSTGGEGDVELDNGSGEVIVGGHRGRVVADTGSGRVKITGCECEISADTGSGSVEARGLTDVRSLEIDTGSGDVNIEGDLSALTQLHIDTGSGSVKLRSLAQPSMEIRIDTGSGDVNVNAPGASVRESDGVTTVRMKDGTHRGVIDTGSGSVDLNFQ